MESTFSQFEDILRKRVQITENWVSAYMQNFYEEIQTEAVVTNRIDIGNETTLGTFRGYNG
jgi:hypothetical protein